MIKFLLILILLMPMHLYAGWDDPRLNPINDLDEETKKVYPDLKTLVPAIKPDPKINSLGVYGRVYPVIEKDFIEGIKERQVEALKNFDLEKFKKEINKKIENFVPEDAPDFIPRAQKDKIKLVDMTWELITDITAPSGRILYPKGHKINPLEGPNALKIDDIFIFINADDEQQVKWFIESRYSKMTSVMLIITEGSWYELAKKLKREVFYANEWIVSRFKIEAVPSVLYQKGTMMESREVYIHEQNFNKTKKKNN